MKSLYKSIFAVSICSVFLSSCATVFTSKNQEMSFDSNESDVEIYINNQKMCTAPCVTEVAKSNNTMLIVAKKQGFEDTAITVDRRANIVTLLNFISFIPTGSFGFSTDSSTNKMWEYQPNAFYITMEKVDNSPAAQKRKVQEGKIRKYILNNFAEMKVEASASGEKEYAAALSSMTGIPEKKIVSLLERYDDDVSFTNAVLEEY
ncbi:MAG: hypothetical protein LBR70_05560 [Lactobacillaceae bacterium]|jgi:hypothetical protein|nr:hypothetical protein [Lactobacillaceae bacterium]